MGRPLRPAPRRHALGALLATATAAAALATIALPAAAQDKFIVMASTTSTEQSGLFPHLLPAFKKARGIDVRVVAVGTGQALDMGRRGDADVLFVHDTAAEEKFVAEGFGLVRRAVMYNDFVLIGPAADPANVRGQDIVTALGKIAASTAGSTAGSTAASTGISTATAPIPFISRADKSGTHAAELRYWKLAGTDDPAVKLAGKPFDYRACGCGMGAALNIASSADAYVLADRGTWLAFKNRGNLRVLVEGDKRLLNPYGVIVVNPARHPQTKTGLAQAFSDWVVSKDGQAAIAAYRVGGEQLFFPNAVPQ